MAWLTLLMYFALGALVSFLFIWIINTAEGTW